MPSSLVLLVCGPMQTSLRFAPWHLQPSSAPNAFAAPLELTFGPPPTIWASPWALLPALLMARIPL
jgi:hypothetical protein